MRIHLTINGEPYEVEAAPYETLLTLLRREGFFSVKHGCEDGTCGACTVLVDGTPRTACTMLAPQAQGRAITTVEGLSRIQATPADRPGASIPIGWRGHRQLHALQEAFIETGAIQCGYCTPAMLLVAKALLDEDPNPTEAEVRDALSGILCRCTGYAKPVQAVLRAAARLRGEEVPPLTEAAIPAPPGLFEPPSSPPPEPPASAGPTGPAQRSGTALKTTLLPTMVVTPEREALQVVGKPEPKVDSRKLVQGRPAFADDFEMRGMLIGKLLLSPLPHARIKRIDVSKARALPGVHAVLTYRDLPRVPFSTAGQSDPIPGPLDRFSLDEKVRFVGDRVAAVAAESEEIAQRALELIEVEYEELPAILEAEAALASDAPIIHDEPDYVGFGESDPSRNIAAQIELELGDVEAAFTRADHVFEATYRLPKVQHAALEPHVCITYWDEDDRLVVRTSTQVPFHTRRMLAPILGLPVRRIRVIKPRIGGGFGGKQEMLIEDICAHLTLVTGRPVRMEYTRHEEFIAATSRHPMVIRVRTGVMQDGTIVANEMEVLSDTGAYGNHAMTVPGNTLHKALALYNAPNIRGRATAVYTNTPPSGAMRGYGVPQGFFAMEVHMERIARALGLDPLAFRLQNALKPGDEHPISKVWTEGREGHPEVIRTVGLPQCVEQGAAAIGWHEKYGNPDWHRVPDQPHLRRGIGVATVMQGTAIAYLDMGAATIKMNDDGSFNLMVGATDLGTGSDTVLAQMAAEVLGCPVEAVLVYSSDTDFTPFDKGAYASSTTYVSGMAVVRAAEMAARQVREVAARLLDPEGGLDPEAVRLHEGRAWAPDGRSVTLAEVALDSLHHHRQHQIMGIGTYVAEQAPPPFAAQFAEVTVDTETGQVWVDRLVMAVDSGVIVNPITASGQVEGGMIQALGYALSEEMVFDERGRLLNPRFGPYKLFRADEVPPMEVIFVETHEPTGPFGVKAVAEIPMDGVAPAVVNALYDAVGVWITELPITPERVWRALQALRKDR